MPVVIAPSLLAADLGRLAEEIESVASGGADWLHIDVMDGSFVPPITFGTNVVTLAKKVAPTLPRDVHLMIEKPERHLEAFVAAGASILTVHQEVSPHLHRTVGEIKRLGCRAGVTVNPATPVDLLFPVLPLVDLVLIMTVNPGWGGQPFIQETLPKIGALRAELTRIGRQDTVAIEVDGGITPETARACQAQGASVFVAGSAIFGSQDRTKGIREIRGS